MPPLGDVQALLELADDLRRSSHRILQVDGEVARVAGTLVPDQWSGDAARAYARHAAAAYRRLQELGAVCGPGQLASIVEDLADRTRLARTVGLADADWQEAVRRLADVQVPEVGPADEGQGDVWWNDSEAGSGYHVHAAALTSSAATLEDQSRTLAGVVEILTRPWPRTGDAHSRGLLEERLEAILRGLARTRSTLAADAEKLRGALATYHQAQRDNVEALQQLTERLRHPGSGDVHSPAK